MTSIAQRRQSITWTDIFIVISILSIVIGLAAALCLGIKFVGEPYVKFVTEQPGNSIGYTIVAIPTIIILLLDWAIFPIGLFFSFLLLSVWYGGLYIVDFAIDYPWFTLCIVGINLSVVIFLLFYLLSGTIIQENHQSTYQNPPNPPLYVFQASPIVQRKNKPFSTKVKITA